jgi:Holliday junction DNA helicase RuvA
MYEYLEGRLFERTAARLVLDVGGVGFDLHVPLGLPFPAAEPLRVWTHLSVREDAHTLYGFPSRETRDLFRTLLVVRGVGPAMALAILSTLTPAELIGAIAAGETRSLVAVKGVGKKTAQQILLDLKDRLGSFAALSGQAPVQPAAAADDGYLEDAVGALISIGYKEKDARKGVERAAKEVGTDDLELLVRSALRS